MNSNRKKHKKSCFLSASLKTRPLNKSLIKKQDETTPTILNFTFSKYSGISVVIIFLMTIVSFNQVTSHEFLIYWDDGAQIFNNPDITHLSFSSIQKIFSSFYVGMYQPLATLSFAFDHALFGMSARAFHISNLVYHLIATLLVYILLSKFFKDKTLIFFLTLLFSVHPTAVETVSWLSARSNILFSIFYLSGLIVYLNFIKTSRPKYYWYMLVFFLLSCFSKSAAITFPLVLLTIDLFYNRLSWKKLKEKIPFFAFAAVFGILTIHARTEASHFVDLSEKYPLAEYVLIVFYSVFLYLKLLFLPFGNNAFYVYPEKLNNSLSLEFYISLAICTIILVLTIIYLYKRRRPALFGLLFFIASLFIMLKIMPTGSQYMADRYLYLPMIGILIFIGHFTEILFLKKQMITLVCFILISGSFALKTMSYNKYWHNDETLFEKTLIKQPDAIPCENLLGVICRKKGDCHKAMLLFNDVIKKCPLYGNAYNNRGNLYKDMKDYDKAISDYKMAIRCKEIDNKGKAEIFTNMGIAFALKKEWQQSMRCFNSAIAENNKFYLAYFNRSRVNFLLDDFDNALKDIDTAISIEPGFTLAYNAREIICDAIEKRKIHTYSSLSIPK